MGCDTLPRIGPPGRFPPAPVIDIPFIYVLEHYAPLLDAAVRVVRYLAVSYIEQMEDAPKGQPKHLMCSSVSAKSFFCFRVIHIPNPSPKQSREQLNRFRVRCRGLSSAPMLNQSRARSVAIEGRSLKRCGCREWARAGSWGHRSWNGSHADHRVRTFRDIRRTVIRSGIV